MRGQPPCLALLGLTVVAMAALAQPPAGAPGTTPPPAKVSISPTAAAATVNGEVILEMAVQRSLDRANVPADKRASARQHIIEFLADNLIIDQSLRAAPAYKVEEAEVNKRIAETKEQMKKFGKDFDKMLAENQFTEAEFRQHVGAEMRWMKYAMAQATDKALTELFNRDKEMFDGTAVRARHILVTSAGNDEASLAAAANKVRAIKKAIEDEVAAGMAKLPPGTDKLKADQARSSLLVEAFSKQAKEKSECPTKAAGGDVNWFQKAGLMAAPFANAAFALQPMQMSDVVRTPFGMHLILVTERKPGKEVKFEEVKEVVREVYFDRLHDYAASELRKKAKIVVNPPPK
jgi:peptidyl-prolyl cis-trans isomerase C